MKYLATWYGESYTKIISSNSKRSFCIYLITDKGLLELIKGIASVLIVYLSCPKVRVISPTQDIFDNLKMFLFSEFAQYFEEYLERKEPTQLENLMICIRMVLDRNKRRDSDLNRIVNESYRTSGSMGEGAKREQIAEVKLKRLEESFDRYKKTRNFHELQKIVDEYEEADYALYSVRGSDSILDFNFD